MSVTRYASIKNNVVVNISLWDGDISVWQPPNDELCIPAPDHVGMGWRYEQGIWLMPVPNQNTDLPNTPPNDSEPLDIIDVSNFTADDFLQHGFTPQGIRLNDIF